MRCLSDIHSTLDMAIMVAYLAEVVDLGFYAGSSRPHGRSRQPSRAFDTLGGFTNSADPGVAFK